MKVLRALAVAVLVMVYAAGLCAGWLAPAGYAAQFREEPGAPPSKEHVLGTDELGRDLLARLLHGTRITLVLAPAAALLTTAVATLVGGLGGYAGGWLDAGLMKLADLLMSLPWLFLLLIARATLPLNVSPVTSVLVTFLLLGLLGWAAPARIIRAATKCLRDEEYILQARAYGCRPPRLLARHVLPNVRHILAAQFWISIPVFILSEANLGFLGLGVGEPVPSWGNLLRGLENYQVVFSNPYKLAPLILLITVVACFHFVMPMEDLSK